MRSIWAVAINTVKQALRMKIAAVFIILLVVLLPVMGMIMTGDGTIKGRLQTFVSYGLSLTAFLLSLLTIVASIYSVTSDFEHRQIYTVLTKPIRRFELIFGKLLGVILLDVALLVLFSGVIYGITIYTPKFVDADVDEFTRLENEFFTARAALVPDEPDVSKEVRELYEKLEKSGQVPPEVYRSETSKRNYLESLTGQRKLEKRAAAPGRELIWHFSNVEPLGADQSLFIRFKYNVSINPPDLQVSSRWFIGDDRQLQYGRSETPIYTNQRRDLVRTFYEMEVPADAVAEDGYLTIGFLNDPRENSTVIIFPPGDGLRVLYRADTFTNNFIRAVFLILFRLIFLSCLGILASSFLSFPVAILLCLLVFFTGTVSGFVIESFDSMNESITEVYRYTLKPLIRLLPQFDKFNPTKFLVPAELLSWSLLGKAAGLMVGIKAFLLLLVGLLIFSRREIAKITV